MSENNGKQPVRGGGSVPITISYRRVTKRPKIERKRAFIGWSNVIRNIAIKAIEFVEDLAYEVTSEELEAGESQVVHWALNVEDPWGPNNMSRIVAYKTGADRPPAGASFEVITIEPEDTTRYNPVSGEPVTGEETAPRPPNHDEARERMRAAIRREGLFDPEAGPPED